MRKQNGGGYDEGGWQWGDGHPIKQYRGAVEEEEGTEKIC